MQIRVYEKERLVGYLSYLVRRVNGMITTKLQCSKCGNEMDLSVDVEREGYLLRRYYIWKCPYCGHIHTEEI